MSIYDAIGGSAAVGAAVDDFYVRVLGDPELEGLFTGTDLSRLKSHQRAFIAAALGGPELYKGRDLGSAHAHLGLEDRHFDAVVGHLAATLASLGVPEETIGEIASALAPLRADIVSGGDRLAG
ncbi:group 1 truncated hemoglobin [Actinocorallia sp. B10E7]|uniref:group I truncated hemoglobin n=1 Tax=Actinocorallia sp. B10E7 TaxID=3153558 RepID=UPI00325F4D69